MTRRFCALLNKELLDLARNKTALVPVVLVAAIIVVLPVIVTVAIPAATHRPIDDDPNLVKISVAADIEQRLETGARVELFLFEQCLMLFLVMPITGAMSLAAQSVVGEKQARTLEPLLATPITTLELLVAKVIGALVPTLVIAVVSLLIYFIEIAVFAKPGVLNGILTGRTAVLVGLIGPAAALVSLQSAVLISSRVNDARTAQQFAVLIVIPLTAIVIAQFTGSLWLGTPMLVAVGIVLLLTWALLTLFSVAMFEREAILTRWK